MRRVLAALRDFFGGAELGYSEDDVTDPRWIIQLGVAPVRIDLMSQIPGFGSFDTAWRKRVDATFGSVPAHYIGLDELIGAKGAVDRPQDRADLRILERAKSGTRLTTRSSRRRRKTRRG